MKKFLFFNYVKQALEDHHHHYISDTVRSNKLNAIEDQKTDFPTVNLCMLVTAINCEKNYIDRDFYLIHIKQKKRYHIIGLFERH